MEKWEQNLGHFDYLVDAFGYAASYTHAHAKSEMKSVNEHNMTFKLALFFCTSSQHTIYDHESGMIV